MTYAFDIKKAILLSLVIAGLVFSTALVSAHQYGGGNGNLHYIIMQSGAPTGCTTLHSHEYSHVCNVDTYSYNLCQSDAAYHCENGLVSQVDDHVGSYCQFMCW